MFRGDGMTSLSSPALDPFFVTIEAASLTSWRIGGLLSGRTAVLRVPRLVSPETCAEIVEGLDGLTLDLYNQHRVDPPIARFGPAINDFRRDGRLDDSYWAEAADAERAWAGVNLRCDPVTLAIEAIRRAWPRPVRIATAQGRELFAG